MGNKRKRDETNDSDSEEVTPGKQILPVANLPDDFDQEPQDGLQYLFLVRRNARRLPHVTRVRNPYETPETTDIPIPMDTSVLSPNVLPCEAWRTVFQIHFSNLRKNLAQPTVRASFDHSSPRRRIMPDKKSRDAWWKFLAGYPELAWMPRHQSPGRKSHSVRGFSVASDVIPPDAQSIRQSSPIRAANFIDTAQSGLQCGMSSRNPPGNSKVVGSSTSSEEAEERHTESLSPPEVTPTYLQEIDHRMSIHLLMYFTHWINIHLQNPSDTGSIISSNHGRWIFALLAKVEDQLSADEMNLLRNLARACLRLIRNSRVDAQETAVSSESQSGRVQGEKDTRMSDGSCWIIFSAIAGHWGQRDLWADAEAMLAQG